MDQGGAATTWVCRTTQGPHGPIRPKGKGEGGRTLIGVLEGLGLLEGQASPRAGRPGVPWPLSQVCRAPLGLLLGFGRPPFLGQFGLAHVGIGWCSTPCGGCTLLVHVGPHTICRSHF